MNYEQMALGPMDGRGSVAHPVLNAAEIERVLASHPQVAEVVVVPIALANGGQVLAAFITLKDCEAGGETLRGELTHRVREQLGSTAVPDAIHFAPSLPKTRSGKIMRDMLEEIART